MAGHLWLTLEYTQEVPRTPLVYIEEPEAHLFPTAQSELIEYLASLVSRPSGPKMVISTHSPYVLSQINILLKAGSLTQANPALASQVEAVVKKKNWLYPASTAAYAIVGKRLISLLDEDGLVDGEYLDEVSVHLSRDFNRLLGVELGE